MTAGEKTMGSVKRKTKTVGSTRYPGSKMIYMFPALSASEGTLPIQDMERQMGLVLFLYSFLERMVRTRTPPLPNTHTYHTHPF